MMTLYVHVQNTLGFVTWTRPVFSDQSTAIRYVQFTTDHTA
jgi:hypothetical protein